MRFDELEIRTLREAPANARGIGDALLKRAGYLGLDGAPTPLGEMALNRLRDSGSSREELFSRLGMRAHQTADDRLVVESPEGAFEILRCQSCGYRSEVKTARRAFEAAPPEEPLPVRRVTTPDCHTIEALSRFLQIPESKTAKAMMYLRTADNQFVFVVLRGDTRLNVNKLETAVGALQQANPRQLAAVGAVPGYASPVGLRDALVVVDELVRGSANLVAGANEAGFHLLNTNCGRDYQADVIGDFTLAASGDPCPDCGQPLGATRAYLVADASGYRYETILLALAGERHDERGLCLPPAAAPFAAHLIQLPSKTGDTSEFAKDVYQQMSLSGLSVLFDDRDARAGVKFHDADLIGLPTRLTAGERGSQKRMVEFKARKSSDVTMVPVAEVAEAVRSVVGAS